MIEREKCVLTVKNFVHIGRCRKCTTYICDSPHSRNPHAGQCTPVRSGVSDPKGGIRSRSRFFSRFVLVAAFLLVVTINHKRRGQRAGGVLKFLGWSEASVKGSREGESISNQY